VLMRCPRQGLHTSWCSDAPHGVVLINQLGTSNNVWIEAHYY